MRSHHEHHHLKRHGTCSLSQPKLLSLLQAPPKHIEHFPRLDVGPLACLNKYNPCVSSPNRPDPTHELTKTYLPAVSNPDIGKGRHQRGWRWSQGQGDDTPPEEERCRRRSSVVGAAQPPEGRRWRREWEDERQEEGGGEKVKLCCFADWTLWKIFLHRLVLEWNIGTQLHCWRKQLCGN
jgi:hypothetical protein